MATTEEIVIKLKDEFSAQAKSIQGAMNGIGVAAAALGVAFVSGKLAEGIKSSVLAFAESEKGIKQLEASLKNLGGGAEKSLGRYLEFAEAIKKTTFFTDEQVVSAERLLVQYGVYGDQLERTIKVAADFASVVGGDLDSAVKVLLRATENGGSGLGRYAINIDEAKVKAGGLNEVLKAVGDQMQGASSAAMDAQAGRIKRLSDAWDDAGKAIGGFFSKVDEKLHITGGLSTILEKIADLLHINTTESEKLSQAIKDTANNIETLKTRLQALQMLGQGDSAGADNFKMRIEEQVKALGRLEEKKIQIASGSSDKKMGSDAAALKKNLEAFEKFYASLVGMEQDSSEKIKKETMLRFHKLDAIYKAGGVTYADFLKAETEITKIESEKQQALMVKNVQEVSAKVGGGFDTLTAALKGNITGVISGIGSMFGPMGTALASAANSIVGTMSAIFDALDGDMRTSFQKFTDYLDELNSAFDETERKIQGIRDEQTRVNTGQEIQPLSREEGMRLFREQFGFESPNFAQDLVLRRSETGDIIALIGDRSIGYLDSSGVSHVTGGFGGMYESDSLAILQKIFAAHASQVSQYQGPGRAQGGVVYGDDNLNARLTSGEYVVSRRGVNQRTIGMLNAINAGQMPEGGGGNHYTIHALDAASFEEFLRRTGGDVLRRMSGREGMVFLHSRGVSNNA